MIVDSLQPKSTQKSIQQVKKLTELLPKVKSTQTSGVLLDLIGRISDDFVEAYMKGNFAEMNELIRVNHWALNGLGVSTASLNSIVQKGHDLGYGGKLTGGGNGGCCFFLLPKGEGPKLASALLPNASMTTSICAEGVESF